MASRGESPVIPLFFKVMMPGFETRLRLPPLICMKLRGEITKQAILTSSKGSYSVEIGNCSIAGLCFHKGWENFVKSHELQVGEFVIFEQIGHLQFDAIILGLNQCAKLFPIDVDGKEESPVQDVDKHAGKAKRGRGRPPKRKTVESLNREESPVELHEDRATAARGRRRLSDEAASPSVGPRSFVQRIKPYNIRSGASPLYIPRGICTAHHISHSTSISLKGPSGELHAVELTQHSRGRLCMLRGWREFFTSNKLEVGDLCFFEVTRAGSNSIMMDVKVPKYPI